MKNEQVAASSAKDGAFLSGLRVRIKELAQEARFIRFEENKIKNRQKISQIGRYTKLDNGNYQHIYDDKGSTEFWSLRSHRKEYVRPAARSAQLAYGFLRDVPYRKIEVSTKPLDCYMQMEWNRTVKEIKRLATKFSEDGKTNFDEEVDEWLTSE